MLLVIHCSSGKFSVLSALSTATDCEGDVGACELFSSSLWQNLPGKRLKGGRVCFSSQVEGAVC